MICRITIEKRQDVFKLLQRFARFTAVGMVSAIAHYGLLIALVQALNIDPVVASVPAALLGALINYSLNYGYTFHSTKLHRESATKFSIVATIGVLLNTLFMWIGVDIAHVHYLLTQIVATGFVLVWSFSANHWWTFRKN
jgi:putative flippase GtrA